MITGVSRCFNVSPHFVSTVITQKNSQIIYWQFIYPHIRFSVTSEDASLRHLIAYVRSLYTCCRNVTQWPLFHFYSNRNTPNLPPCLYLSQLFLFKSLPFCTPIFLPFPSFLTAASLKFITFYTCLVILNDGFWTTKFGYRLSPPSL